MRRLLIRCLALAVLGIAGFFAATDPAAVRLLIGASPNAPAGSADLENGQTMFHAGGCASCHATPAQPDKTRLGGGLAMHSPFGTFYTPNISSHPRDGIGGWTADDFIRAMREGVSPDGRHYYPAFPFTSYKLMSSKDLSDMLAFMKTLPAVEGRVRDHDVGFPFNVRRLLAGWKVLHLDGKPFQPDPARDAEWNRGAYLVEGPGHCAECHSPRNMLGGIITAKRFAGGPDPEGKDFVPNITPHKDGISGWSKNDIRDFLKTGETPVYSNAGGSMASVIYNMSKLSDADRSAMAAYLASLPPREGRRPVKK